uniref:Uncharacterized protein n=1 Tax=Caenorhabditis japonica TaxID=281687 RepID=A0A8R1I795_CAEJA
IKEITAKKPEPFRAMAHAVQQIAPVAVQMATQYMHPGRRRPKKNQHKPVKNVKPLKASAPPCPTNQVLLEMEVNRKIIRRCQSTCPVSMRSVNGVCKIERRPQPVSQ